MKYIVAYMLLGIVVCLVIIRVWRKCGGKRVDDEEGET